MVPRVYSWRSVRGPSMSHTTLSQLSQDYYRIEKAIAYIKKNANQQPALVDVAASVHLSEFHFQRMFSRWAGISPKRFLQYITKEYAKMQQQCTRPTIRICLYASKLINRRTATNRYF